MIERIGELLPKIMWGTGAVLIGITGQRSLKQAGLLPIFKSRGYVSDVINAKRAISKVHAKELADFFKVSADLFISRRNPLN